MAAAIQWKCAARVAGATCKRPGRLKSDFARVRVAARANAYQRQQARKQRIAPCFPFSCFEASFRMKSTARTAEGFEAELAQYSFSHVYQQLSIYFFK